MNTTLNKKKLNIKFSQTLLLVIMMAVIIVAIALYSDKFLTWVNIKNVFNQNAIYGLVAIGMTLVMIAGGIDLGAGYLLSFCACFMALLLQGGMATWPAALLTLLVGGACGFITGSIIAFTKTQPFIITLGMMYVYKAAAMIVADGSDMPITGFKFLGKTNLDDLLPFLSFEEPVNGLQTFLSSVGSIPMTVFYFILAFVILGFVLKRTGFGRTVYTIGSNEEAAFISGVKVNQKKILLYTLNGVIVALAALILLSKLGSANPNSGDGYEMQAISACAIGGITLTGGVGTALGSFLGIMFLGLIRNGLNLMRVPTFYQYMVNGVIIIIAVIFSNYATKKKS